MKNDDSEPQHAAFTSGGSPKVPIWPLIAAPFAAIVYYSVLNGAFFSSLEYVVGEARDIGALVTPLKDRRWGNHWFYRIVAEIVCLAFGTFIAAGLARDRARTAGIIGGAAISGLWAVVFAFMLSYGVETGERWYQNLITILIIPAAPLIGFIVGEVTKELTTAAPRGFAGIPRGHFLWLWFPTHLYALGLIEPVTRLMSTYDEYGMLIGAFVYALRLIPVAILAVPLYFGLLFLAGFIKQNWHVALQQIAGTGILIGGLIIGGAFQYGIASLVR